MTAENYPIIGRVTDTIERAGNKVRGLFNKETNEPLDPFKPQNRNEFFNENLESISLPTSLSNIDGFNNWENTKVKGLADFGSIKLPNDKTIQSRLGKDVDNLGKANKAINEATAIDPKTVAAKEEFNDLLAAMNKLMQSKNESYTFADYATQLETIKADAKTALSEQHKLEKDKFTALFDDNDFTTHLKTGLELLDQSQLDSLKKSMLAEMDNKHKAEISAFEDKLNTEVKSLQDADQKERDRISYLAIAYELNEAMKREIDRLNAENKTNDDVETHVEIGFGSKEFALFKNIKVKDLNIIEDISGEALTKNTAADGTITYSSKLPRQFFAPLYSSKLAELRLAGIAQAIRASGKDKITLSINYTGRETAENQDDAHAMELGRIAYAKALEAGYKYQVTYAADDKEKKNPICDISIVVNGKKKTADELFRSCRGRLNELHAAADEDEKRRQNYRESQKSTPQTQTNMKKRLRDIVDDGREAKKRKIDEIEPPTLNLGNNTP